MWAKCHVCGVDSSTTDKRLKEIYVCIKCRIPGKTLMLAMKKAIVAKLLKEGKTYEEIKKEVKVSRDTIAGVQKYLKSHKFPAKKVKKR
jgi:uncharacterized protein YerC